MNRKNTYLYIFIYACLMVTSISCDKQLVDEFTQIEEKWESLSDFTSSTSSETTVKIDSGEFEFVVETETAIIHFQAESVNELLTGQLVSGPIEIVYSEFTNYKDLFLTNIDTEGFYGETIYSQYMISFQLKQGATTLELDYAKPAVVYLKKADNVIDHERVFHWKDEADKDGWDLNTNIDVFPEDWDFDVNGVNYQGTGYKMFLRNSGMHALGEHEHLIHVMTDDYGSIDISVNDTFKNADTKVLVARKGDFSLIPLDLLNGKYVNNHVRKDEEVVIFGMTVVDNKLYFGRKNIIVGSTNVYNLNFNEVSYVEAIDQLQRM